MFHVMLVLPALIVLAIAASVVLLGIIAIVAAIVGGTTVALLIKNKITKKLLFYGFCILFLSGLLCLMPILTTYLNLSVMLWMLGLTLIYICIAMCAIAGMKVASGINNKAGQTILTIIFFILLIADICLAVFTVFVRSFF